MVCFDKITEIFCPMSLNNFRFKFEALTSLYSNKSNSGNLHFFLIIF